MVLGRVSRAELDAVVRNAAFAHLNEQRLIHGGESLPHAVLKKGFLFEGRTVHLLGPQGIFTPRELEVPLSITTVPVVPGRERPYADEIGADGLLRYRYRGTDPTHRDNRGLMLALERQAPLVYFHGVVPGWYIPAYPVYVVGADPAALAFTVAVDQQPAFVTHAGERAPGVAENLVRSYVTRLTMRRIHQQAFRQRVLLAYRECCAICRLKHRELLEASHILPDGHPRGEPVLPNGIALCNLHHAAFDRHVLGITPELRVDLRLDVLHETDGPMLRHGLQGFQGARVAIPRAAHQQPNREFLAERYELFKKAG